jgi:rfaE bifunctional protein nucleotidyltransferase chain/domain
MHYLTFLKSKIILEENLGKLLCYWRFHNQKIVFTNGCFDILHRGHVEYLTQAADLGDHLIIGLNSDSSVRKLKGENRPVNNEKDRAFVLAALDFVDAVVVFDKETPLELIKKVQPDVLVKGGDWKVDEIVGSDVVLAKGGEVKSLHFVDGYSTTATIDKMKS